MRNAPRVRVTGWWRVLDRGLLVLAVIVLLMGVLGLLRDDLPTWWALSVVVMVLAGTGTRWLVERHRPRLPTEANPSWK
jgi:uncharacterized membrane-anchored protein